jgi:fatty acid desaturase
LADTALSHDYSLTGETAKLALETGLASAQWYQAPIPRARMKELMQRSDGPAIRDTIIWFASFIILGGIAAFLFPSWWSLPFFLAYGVLWGSSSDSRWHECGHGTAFKTRWKNDAIYQVACFMIMREPRIWRWSHTRHHTDTLIVGRDPEIAVMKPTVIVKVISAYFAIPQTYYYFKSLFTHATGNMTADEMTFVPEQERGAIYTTARVTLALHLAIIAFSWWMGSILPMLLAGPLPSMYGAWTHVMTGVTQHAGMPENVLDHRLNCRTVYMNSVLRFIYWNMNYHIEHHMYPMVPYHRLPELHEELKPYCPPPYHSTFAAYREIIPALFRQARNPGWTIKRPLPTGTEYVPKAAPQSAAEN